MILVYILVTILFVAFPLYFSNGYESIATNKYRFFMITALCAGIVFLAHFVVTFFISKAGQRTKIVKVSKSSKAPSPSNASKNPILYTWVGSLKGLDYRDLILSTVGLYAVTSIISWIFSPYKVVDTDLTINKIPWFKPGSFFGARSWYMGLATILLCIVLCLMVAHYLEFKESILIPVLAGGLVVAIWGSLNRYDIYPLEMAYASETFISSLGNVDWYTGYLVLIAPIAYGLYLIADSKFKKVTTFFISYIFLFATLISGADSGILALLITFVVGLAISLGSKEMYTRFLGLLCDFFLALLTIRFLDLIFDNPRNLDAGIGELLISTKGLVLVAVFVLLGGLINLICFRQVSQIRNTKSIKNPLSTNKADVSSKNNSDGLPRNFAGRVVMLVFTLAVLGLIALIAINTLSDTKLPLIGDHPLMNFDLSWGSNRGACYYISLEIFKDASPLEKLIGIGPDAFGFRAYELESVQEISSKYFWVLTLTNAHCEPLNILVNEGILGLCAYAALWIVIFRSLLKSRPKNKFAIIFILAFASYLANNLVSFRQIEAMPLLWTLIGIYLGTLPRSKKA